MYKYNVRLKYASTCMYKFYYDSDTINVFVQLTFIWSLFVLCVKIKIIYDMNKFKHKKN